MITTTLTLPTTDAELQYLFDLLDTEYCQTAHEIARQRDVLHGIRQSEHMATFRSENPEFLRRIQKDIDMMDFKAKTNRSIKANVEKSYQFYWDTKKVV